MSKGILTDKHLRFLLMALVLVLGATPKVQAVDLSVNLNPPKKIQGKVSVLAVQQSLVDAVNTGQKMENIDRSVNIAKKFPGYDLYVFPELSVSGYSADTFDRLDILADPPGPKSETFRQFSKLAKQLEAYVVYGCPTYYFDPGSKEKKYHISAFLISPQGELEQIYHKNYLFDMERKWFRKGWREGEKNPVAVFNINKVPLGLLICYDMRFPELWREMSMQHGVVGFTQILATAKDYSHASWHTVVTARAVENLSYVLSLNRAGALYGESVFIQPGTPKAEMFQLTPVLQSLGNGEGVIGAVIDQSIISKLRKRVTIVEDGASHFPKYKKLNTP